MRSGNIAGKMFFEGSNYGSDLIGIDDFAIQLGRGIYQIFVEFFPAFLARQLFTLVHKLTYPDRRTLVA